MSKLLPAYLPLRQVPARRVLARSGAYAGDDFLVRLASFRPVTSRIGQDIGNPPIPSPSTCLPGPVGIGSASLNILRSPRLGFDRRSQFRQGSAISSRSRHRALGAAPGCAMLIGQNSNNESRHKCSNASPRSLSRPRWLWLAASPPTPSALWPVRPLAPVWPAQPTMTLLLAPLSAQALRRLARATPPSADQSRAGNSLRPDLTCAADAGAGDVSSHGSYRATALHDRSGLWLGRSFRF